MRRDRQTASLGGGPKWLRLARTIQRESLPGTTLPGTYEEGCWQSSPIERVWQKRRGQGAASVSTSSWHAAKLPPLRTLATCWSHNYREGAHTQMSAIWASIRGVTSGGRYMGGGRGNQFGSRLFAAKRYEGWRKKYSSSLDGTHCNEVWGSRLIETFFLHQAYLCRRRFQLEAHNQEVESSCRKVYDGSFFFAVS